MNSVQSLRAAVRHAGGMDVDRARATQLANIEQATGTPVAVWTERIEAERTRGLSHAKLVAWLKSEHGLTHGNANALVHAAAARDAGEVDLVGAQYAGPKADLRPLYDLLVTTVTGFGDDVEIAPKKTSVSLRRSKQFAVLTAAARTRIDIGLNLGDQEPVGVLEAASGMCTHRIRVSAAADVDETVIRWLRSAYDRA